MHWSSFERANRFGNTCRRKLFAYALGCCSSLPAVLLAANVGLIAHLLLNRNGGGQTPRDWFLEILQSFVGSDITASGWWGRSDYYLLALIAAFLVLSLLESLLMLLHFRMADGAAQETVGRLQAAICEQVPRLAAAERFSAEIRSPERLLTDSSDVLRDGLSCWWKALPRAACLVSVFVLLAVVVDFFLTLCALLLAAFAWWICHRMQRRMNAEVERNREQAVMRREGLLDQIHSARSISAFSQEPAAKAPLAEAIRRYGEDRERAIARQLALGPSLFLLSYLSAALIVFVVGFSQQTSLTNAAILAYVFGRAYFPMYRLRRALATIGDAEEAATEVFAYLDRVPPVGQIAGAMQLVGISQQVRVDGVSLAVDGGDKVLLSGVSLSVPAGAHAAILATCEATKRALADLVLRFKDPDDGRILLDDADLRTITLDSLRSRTAFAPADGMLFTGSVADNIQCARSGFGHEHVQQAAKLIGVFDAVQQLPQSFQATIGPYGRTLSKTVAFQIGLARAVLANPSLIIIEELPQPLDENEDAQIDAVHQAIANRMAIVLASRLATLRDADIVYLLHEGKLHAQGTHAELLQQDELYRHLNYLLFNPFRDL